MDRFLRVKNSQKIQGLGKNERSISVLLFIGHPSSQNRRLTPAMKHANLSPAASACPRSFRQREFR
jgi:hypothetical protein